MTTDSFGARLRRQREQQQLTLAQIAATTKIQASLFAGLERDDVSRWPSGLFRRSFVRAYADAIGLDPEAVCREFIERFPDPHGPEPAVSVSRGGSPAVESQARPVAAVGPSSRGSSAGLRLTLADTGLPFSAGRLLPHPVQRLSAILWDAGSLVAVALCAFFVVGSFWMPFGITALCYYVGSILVLGNTPGVCLFAPRIQDEAPEPDRGFDSRLLPLDDVAYGSVHMDQTRVRA